ncbi:MAG: hypothetical protein FWE53_00855 [Firmicutes bacterium]|nr:hypothetical protein [Bacillota bacterium]
MDLQKILALDIPEGELDIRRFSLKELQALFVPRNPKMLELGLWEIASQASRVAGVTTPSRKVFAAEILNKMKSAIDFLAWNPTGKYDIKTVRGNFSDLVQTEKAVKQLQKEFRDGIYRGLLATNALVYSDNSTFNTNRINETFKGSHRKKAIPNFERLLSKATDAFGIPGGQLNLKRLYSEKEKMPASNAEFSAKLKKRHDMYWNTSNIHIDRNRTYTVAFNAEIVDMLKELHDYSNTKIWAQPKTDAAADNAEWMKEKTKEPGKRELNQIKWLEERGLPLSTPKAEINRRKSNENASNFYFKKKAEEAGVTVERYKQMQAEQAELKKAEKPKRVKLSSEEQRAKQTAYAKERYARVEAEKAGITIEEWKEQKDKKQAARKEQRLNAGTGDFARIAYLTAHNLPMDTSDEKIAEIKKQEHSLGIAAKNPKSGLTDAERAAIIADREEKLLVYNRVYMLLFDRAKKAVKKAAEAPNKEFNEAIAHATVPADTGLSTYNRIFIKEELKSELFDFNPVFGKWGENIQNRVSRLNAAKPAKKPKTKEERKEYNKTWYLKNAAKRAGLETAEQYLEMKANKPVKPKVTYKRDKDKAYEYNKEYRANETYRGLASPEAAVKAFSVLPDEPLYELNYLYGKHGNPLNTRRELAKFAPPGAQHDVQKEKWRNKHAENRAKELGITIDEYREDRNAKKVPGVLEQKRIQWLQERGLPLDTPKERIRTLKNQSHSNNYNWKKAAEKAGISVEVYLEQKAAKEAEREAEKTGKEKAGAIMGFFKAADKAEASKPLKMIGGGNWENWKALQASRRRIIDQYGLGNDATNGAILKKTIAETKDFNSAITHASVPADTTLANYDILFTGKGEQRTGLVEFNTAFGKWGASLAARRKVLSAITPQEIKEAELADSRSLISRQELIEKYGLSADADKETISSYRRKEAVGRARAKTGSVPRVKMTEEEKKAKKNDYMKRYNTGRKKELRHERAADKRFTESHDLIKDEINEVFGRIGQTASGRPKSYSSLVKERSDTIVKNDNLEHEKFSAHEGSLAMAEDALNRYEEALSYFPGTKFVSTNALEDIAIGYRRAFCKADGVMASRRWREKVRAGEAVVEDDWTRKILDSAEAIKPTWSSSDLGLGFIDFRESVPNFIGFNTNPLMSAYKSMEGTREVTRTAFDKNKLLEYIAGKRERIAELRSARAAKANAQAAER